MAFGDIALNNEVDEEGYNRCHGVYSPARTPPGDIARLVVTAVPGTPEYEAQVRKCIYQRIAIWKATKKGERQFNGRLGCCIRDYFNTPLTATRLIDLRDDVEKELKQIFPEFNVVNVRVRSDARNSVTIESVIGNFDIVFSSNPSELEENHDQMSRAMKGLNVAMRDLRIGVPLGGI